MDRFLVSIGILSSFPHLSGMVLEKNIPYHRLILMVEHAVNYGPTSF